MRGTKKVKKQAQICDKQGQVVVLLWSDVFIAFTSLGEFQQFQETKRLGNDTRPKVRTRCASLATRHFVADHPEKCRNDVVIEPGAQVA